jgi:TRAP-type C4-dicarboxylate transport system substrate-binding protein
MKRLHAALALLLTLTFSLLSSSSVAISIDEDGVIHLTYASSYSSTQSFSRADLDWIDYIERESNGRIKIRPFWSATLLSNDENMLELRHGVADIAMITPIYSRSGSVAIRAQTGFYAGATEISTQVEVFHCLLRDFPVFQRELEGVKLLVVQGGTPSYILTQDRTIESLNDLAGLRLRAPTAVVPVLYELGGDALLMPMGDVYPALSKGTIDGVVTPMDALYSLRFAEIGDYMNMLTIHRGGYPSRAMSNRSWERIPADLQQLLLESGRYWEDRIAYYVIEGDRLGQELAIEEGVEFIQVSDKVQEAFNVIQTEVARQDAQRLYDYGIDGEAILEYANNLIRRINAGEEVNCREW